MSVRDELDALILVWHAEHGSFPPVLLVTGAQGAEFMHTATGCYPYTGNDQDGRLIHRGIPLKVI